MVKQPDQLDISQVPQAPGVYLWQSATGETLYIGKAKQLRSRMRQYISRSDERLSIPQLMSEAASFDYIVTNNETEALLLERNLVRKHKPRYNVDLKDDSSYPYIALCLDENFPSIKHTREKPKANRRYFGPYTDSYAARLAIETLRKVIPLCASNCAEHKQLERGKSSPIKPCFDYHIGIGPGACAGLISQADYAGQVRQATEFLMGKRAKFTGALNQRIEHAAASLDFEIAARLKKSVDALVNLDSKQVVELPSNLNADIIGVFREETIAGVALLQVREGSLMGSTDYILNKGKDVELAELLRSFVLDIYEKSSSIPRLIIVEELPGDAELLESLLTTKLANIHQAKVTIQTSSRGVKSDLLKLANKNAQHALNKHKASTHYADERANLALLELESALSLEHAPVRIESFDISTLHGTNSVASMVVFTAGRPAKKDYRRFKIKLQTADGEANDAAMMAEVLRRRFTPLNKFGQLPDLIILDGGKPQITAVKKLFAEMNIAELDNIALTGLAKRDEELFTSWSNSSVILPTGSASLYLIKAIRDEAHRFAITYHRKLRLKSMLK